MPELCGLLVDWGGVLTTNVFTSFSAFAAREGLDPDAVRDLFRTDPRAHELLVGLEEGTLATSEFDQRFAALLGVDGQDLIVRMMGDTRAEAAMVDAVRSARQHGIATGLISNSWGVDRYDTDLMNELFDAVVISGTVGIRKPAPEIYAMGARAIHLEPADCVYVDDLPGNLKPARALGMTTIHHTDPEATVTQLSALLGVAL